LKSNCPGSTECRSWSTESLIAWLDIMGEPPVIFIRA
jgi:hypothetical protein